MKLEAIIHSKGWKQISPLFRATRKEKNYESGEITFDTLIVFVLECRFCILLLNVDFVKQCGTGSLFRCYR